jgi:hypothetical protein
MSAPARGARDALFDMENHLLYIRGIASCLILIANSDALGDKRLTLEAMHYLGDQLVAHHANARKAYDDVFDEAVKVLR